LAGGRASELIKKAYEEGRRHLLEPEAKAICAEYGIPVPRGRVAKTPEEAVEVAEEIGYPVVLKVVSPDVLHKSDVGGVLLSILDEDGVREGFKRILDTVRSHKPGARILGILVEEMAPRGVVEVIVGAIKDPQFGQTLMFGLGGIFVEVLKDVSFRVAPIEERDAYEMISEIRAYPILRGYRGQPPADVDTIARILLSASRLVMEHPEIKEMDLNPIIVYEKGAKTVDARIILE